MTTQGARPVSRRDFLRLRRSAQGRVLEVSCRTLFMRLSDASLDAGVDDTPVAPFEPSMGEPPAQLDRPSATDLVSSFEQELQGVNVLRLLEPEWLDSMAAAPQVRAVIEAFRARGGLVEQAASPPD